MDNVIQTSELSKCFRKSTVVDKVGLHIAKGDIYGFIGQNGAGKTTTIRMILNLIRPSGGTVELFGEKVTDRNIYSHLRKIGAIIETPGFYQNLTGRENLDIHRILMDVPDKSSIDRALKLVGLSDEKDKRIRHYSLGMKQRLGLARALLHDPELLVLDEPTNGLDPQGIVEIRDLLTEIARSGKTIFISSHILAEVEKMVTRIGILHKGKLLEEISREDFIKKCSQSLLFSVNDPGKAANLIHGLLSSTGTFASSGLSDSSGSYVSSGSTASCSSTDPTGFPGSSCATNLSDSSGLPGLAINEDCVVISSPKDDYNSKITKLLVENDIEVKESRLIRSTLEDYFIHLTGGNSHE